MNIGSVIMNKRKSLGYTRQVLADKLKAAVKVNTEQLYFNWQLGRDLVERKAEEKWGKGIVEQLSLDLQNEFPDAKGFSARNLWNMKKWYLFRICTMETSC